MKTIYLTVILITASILSYAQSLKKVQTYYDPITSTKLKESYTVIDSPPYLKNGKYFKYDQRGLKAVEINYVLGKAKGVSMEYYVPQYGFPGDEKLKMVTNYRDGLKNGLSTTYMYVKDGKENLKEGKKIKALERYYNNDVLQRELKFYITGQMEYDGYLINGLVTKWYENGQKSEKYTMKDRKIDGIYNSWHINGQLNKSGTVINGKEEGSWEYYQETGDKQMIENYALGKLSGIKTEYYASGTYTESLYNPEKKTYVYTVYSSGGRKNFQGTIDKSKRLDGSLVYNGPYKKWNENESLIVEGNFMKGKKDGKWVNYNNDGTINFIETYRLDQLVDTEKK